MINPLDLSGKHILITGASSGIGRACAIQASKLGAKVTLIARREEMLQETVSLMENSDIHSYRVFDVSNTDEIEALVKEMVASEGAFDGFVHAAGIATVRPLKQTKVKFMQKMYTIHVYAYSEFIRCLSLNKNMNDGASLVGISSAAAFVGSISQCAYGSAKGAMNSFIIPAAAELGSRKIRVNNVSFAMVNTTMFDEFIEYGGDVSLMNRQYLGVIDVESAANSIIFLLSDACKYITGTVLPVYGGY